MSKTNCSLIKDLLPLYIDDLCSKETTEIVGNHLEICEECNKEYETLKTEPKVKLQEDNSQELIKKVNKKFGKDKKWAVIKTISIILVIIIVAGVVAFLKVPLYLAEEEYINLGYRSAALNYETWEINKKEKSNFENEYIKLYIDEKYGDYEIESGERGAKIVFNDEKQIIIGTNNAGEVGNFDDYKSSYYSSLGYPILFSCIRKGIEDMGFDNKIIPGADYKFVQNLISGEVPEVKFLCTPKQYYEQCAYYACFTTIMPIGSGDSYYIIGENDGIISWGWTMIGESRNSYIMNFQQINQYGKGTYLGVSGFTKEEAQEIFKYAVIK